VRDVTRSLAGLVVFIVFAFAGHVFGQKKPKFAYVVNQCGNVSCTGSGNVSAYTIDSTTGTLTAITGSPFAAGMGPHSVAVDPSGKFAYVANECISINSCSSGNVSAYTFDSTTGALTAVTGSPFAAGTVPVSVAVDGNLANGYRQIYICSARHACESSGNGKPCHCRFDHR
jgi:6-phosphogluconolactonase (cycloisomerase 2 family)